MSDAKAVLRGQVDPLHARGRSADTALLKGLPESLVHELLLRLPRIPHLKHHPATGLRAARVKQQARRPIASAALAVVATPKGAGQRCLARGERGCSFGSRQMSQATCPSATASSDARQQPARPSGQKIGEASRRGS